ncbi:MAG: histidine kinase N-terminal 7TM domain-containing protein [Oscillospiraceae bacterium]|nr:histidine kinase N-terminal 7TM domain-containing protein [Oscillospiraceae bacterium]
MSTVYGLAMAVSLLMIGVYYYVDRKHDKYLLLLFVSVAVSDFGYFLLSLSKTLDAALWSNRIAYLGNVFLPFSLLMMIMTLSRFTYPKWLPKALVAVNTVMLLIAASGGWFPIYYKNVSLDFVNGLPVLIKEYGPLHAVYKVFLFAYFSAMVAVIAYTAVKKTVVSSKHTVFLAFVIIGNIAIWLVENMIHSSFEFLSISYILTEGMILFLYSILQDYGLKDTPQNVDAITEQHIETVEIIKAFSDEQIDSIMKNWSAVDTLSQREKEVLRFLLENKKRKVIAETLFVTESTIKKHTAAIYRKLETANRTELFEKAKKDLNV